MGSSVVVIEKEKDTMSVENPSKRPRLDEGQKIDLSNQWCQTTKLSKFKKFFHLELIKNEKKLNV